MSNKEIVTLEQAASLTGKKAVDFFSDSKNVFPLIEHVKKEALSIASNVNTKKGRDEIGSTALKVSKSRKAIVSAIDNSVSDLKSKISAVNNVKKIVVSDLTKVREDVLAPRNKWQAEQDEIESNRVAEIKGRITNIQNLGDYSLDENKESLAQRIDSLESMDVSEGFSEFTADAATAIASATKLLNNRILHIIKYEKAEAQRKQIEEIKQREKTQNILNALILVPSKMFGKKTPEIRDKIESISNTAIKSSEFGELTEQAINAKETVISQLNSILDNALIVEKALAAKKLLDEHEEAIKINEHDDFFDEFVVEELNIPAVSQLRNNIDDIERQFPPHVDFINWAHDYAIKDDAFLALKVLIKKHLTK